MFLRRNVLSTQYSYVLYICGSLLAKAVPRKDQFMRLRSPTKSTFMCLIPKTLLGLGVMSMDLKNPKDQADHKKGTLSNQPQIMCVAPTALLGR
jgi:hypothetical protein